MLIYLFVDEFIYSFVLLFTAYLFLWISETYRFMDEFIHLFGEIMYTLLQGCVAWAPDPFCGDGADPP